MKGIQLFFSISTNLDPLDNEMYKTAKEGDIYVFVKNS